ncbi:MAG: hypothetical protein JNM47_01575 [Hyphomonadaceae bacterium]|nr:hypothetical protein [Hyphomonadaceae bacterium]
MFGITERLRSAAAAGGLVAVAGTLALIGVVWMTIAAFTVLALYMPEPAAMLVIGLVLMAPLVVVLFQTRAVKKPEPAPEPAAGEFAALAKLVGASQTLSEKSPIAGAALALGAAWFASRSPATSAFAVQIIAEVIDQWAKAQAETPKSPPTDDAAA